MSQHIRQRDILAALLIFITTPLILQGVFFFLEPDWIRMILSIGTLLMMLLYIYLQRTHLGWLLKGNGLRALKIGGIGLLACLPIVYGVSESLNHLLEYFFKIPFVDQWAVTIIKQVMNQPFLFAATLFNVVITGPMLEEIIFRGFLQSFIKQYAGVFSAIILSSVIFALFHFSSNQGIYNISILFSLFVMACILGYVFEKNQNLWASIFLHAGFNLVSITLLLLS